VVIRDDKLVGATLLGDTRKVAFLTQAFDRGAAAARGADPAAVRPLRRPPRRSASPRCRRLAGLQLQRRLQGRRSAVRADGCGSVGGGHGRTRAGKGCGSCKSLVKQIVEWAAGGDVAEDPAASWYVPGIPMAKPS
jgi:nitrite reductase (NADH) large subunit